MIIGAIVFLYLHRNRCCGYSLEAPRRGASNEYHNMFLWRTGENYPTIFTKYSSLTISLAYFFFFFFFFFFLLVLTCGGSNYCGCLVYVSLFKCDIKYISQGTAYTLGKKSFQELYY